MGVYLIGLHLISMRSQGHIFQGYAPHRHASYGGVTLGMHLTGVYLMGMHLAGVCLMGMYLMGVHFIGVSRACHS